MRYCIHNNQDIKIKDMDMNQDNPPSAPLLTQSQHVLSHLGRYIQAQPAHGTTSVVFAFMAMDKLGQLG